MVKVAQKIEIEDLSGMREVLTSVVDDVKGLEGVRYADIRLRVDDGPTVVAENGAIRMAARDSDCCYGVRVIAADGGIGQGYSGGRLGVKDVHSGGAADVLKKSFKEAYVRARTNGKCKGERRGVYGELGDSIIDTQLAETGIHQRIILADFSEDPRKVPLEVLCERAVGITRGMLGVDKNRMQKGYVQMQGLMNREILVTTEGALIDYSYAKSEAFVLAVAQTLGHIPEQYYEALGGMHGLEVFNGRNMFSQPIELFACGLAQEAARLSDAPMLEGKFENVDVVTDGDFNALWVHENVGHPSEADRCLGMEAGYAGRSWFFRNAQKNQLGKKVASPLLNVCSRNDLDCYGRFTHDAEGVEGKKVYHIKDGIFVGFLHSRWSAFVMQQMGIPDQMPNGSMRATNALNVPYIRMKQTGIEGGTSTPAEMIAGIKDGFYLVGKRIPSMSESRENFRISARRTFRIENGRLTTMYRGGTLTADTHPYMMSISAVGNDLGLWPIFNCGKAQPQQVMYLGNPAPSMKAKGNVLGGVK